MPGSFFDTNVLLYVASGDPTKADRAEELIGAGGMISVQVLNEITNVARRKMGMSWTETRAFLSMIRGLLPVQHLEQRIDARVGSTVSASCAVSIRIEDSGCAVLSVIQKPRPGSL